MVKKTIILFASLFFAVPLQANDLAWVDVSTRNLTKEVHQIQPSVEELSKNVGLVFPGQFVTLAQDINLRVDPKGVKIRPVYKGETYQVLGIEKDGTQRYYKIKSKEDIGYIYAGTSKTYQNWAKQTWTTGEKWIPEVGDLVKIKRQGLKISHNKESEETFYRIPRGAKVQIQSIEQAPSGELYYKVEYRSRVGFAAVSPRKNLVSKKTSWKELY